MSEVKYQGKIDLSVKNNSHTMAYDMIARVANGKQLEILEVGCASGYFGEALKAGGHKVWGIEPDAQAAAIAAEALDYVFVGLIEDFIKAHRDKKFDAITFGDVLEHIAEPETVLMQCHALLKEGGALVTSVPNVSHASVRAMLLEGNWDYEELGILDRTHLRFFTRKTIQQLFNDCNYKVVDIDAVTLPTNMVTDMMTTPVSEKSIRAVESFAFDNTQHDFQYVLLGVPLGAKAGVGAQYLARKPRIKVLGVANLIESSHAEVRMIEPLKAWAANCNGELVFKSISDCTSADIEWADVVFIQRHVDLFVEKLVNLATRLGKKVIYETDDNLLDLPEHLSHHKTSLLGYEKHLNTIIEQVDCITVTTDRLAKGYEAFQKPIEVVPNGYVEDAKLPVDHSQWQAGIANLIVASTDKILIDFVMPAINEVINRTDIDVQLIVIGPPAEAFQAAGIPCHAIENMNYAEFKAFIRTVENPIGIIPLDDSSFSACKTAVKFFDYSMAGIPVLCSDVPPYADVIENGEHGLLVDNETAAWVDAVMQCVNDIQLRKRLVLNAQEMVEKKFDRQTISQRLDFVITRLMAGEYQSRKGKGKSTLLHFMFNSLKFYMSHLFNPAHMPPLYVFFGEMA